jgi:metal-sulfur cluster biosynthetic enzyme
MNVISNDNLRCTIALAALEQVKDPEIGLNVVDLGLIYQVDFDLAQQLVSMRMTLTTAFCPMGESISSAVKRVMQNTFPDMKIDLQLSFDPPWNAERISAAGREFLNL